MCLADGGKTYPRNEHMCARRRVNAKVGKDRNRRTFAYIRKPGIPVLIMIPRGIPGKLFVSPDQGPLHGTKSPASLAALCELFLL